ncbi:MAG: hypothetical protein VR72_12990 [Clostridiaceae bacterium BRH_c20a]|nr:MAG: hypothetical protein VR72_12990 [Clostridiaceae bacterium BRH_c20a]
MWAWYFILFVVLLMMIVKFVSSKRKKPFPGIKALLPDYGAEAGAELTPYYKNRSQMLVEGLTGKPLPYFETTIDLYEKTPQKLVAEWSIGDNFKKLLTDEYGQEFWHNCQPVLRINHTNAVPQAYHREIKIELAKGIQEIHVSAPGETLNTEVGVITETGSFIPFAKSNDVAIPKES